MMRSSNGEKCGDCDNCDIFFEVDEKVRLWLGEEVYGRQLENHSSSDKEPGPG